jgi:hypothetical protein
MTVYVNETMAAAPTTGTAVAGAGTIYGWQAGGWYQFNNNVNQWSNYYYTGVLPSVFTMSVDMQMGTTSGADGSWFYYGAASSPTNEGDHIGGYLINRNDYNGAIEIRFDGSTLAYYTYTKDTAFDTFKVDVSGQAFTITYKGSVVLTHTDTTTRTLGGTQYGWGGRSGGTANTHNIQNVLLSSPGGATVPPNLFFQMF